MGSARPTYVCEDLTRLPVAVSVTPITLRKSLGMLLAQMHLVPQASPKVSSSPSGEQAR